MTVFASLVGFVFPCDGAEFSSDELELFERKIRPILVERCYKCHSADSAKLKSGLYLDSREGVLKGGDSLRSAAAPRQPDQSLLIEAIKYQNPDLQMPPKGRLSEDEINDFFRWIEMGIPWPNETPRKRTVQDEEFNLDQRRKAHWSWQPIVPQLPPRVESEDWPRNPVDHFILEKLLENDLQPAPDVERESLIRRLSFDLIGLPPTPSEVRAFVADPSSQAFATVVDRLLGRPEFGERWARHWLDLVRYAETLGHEFDYAVPNAWRYRDYVIRAFNEDVPYKQFVTEHIAGDLLSTPRRHPTEGFNESVIGTGFYWLGQQTHSPVDVRRNQAEVIGNQIDVLTKAFLGLTVACARCHDHKFDAISTKDYYSLYSIIESSRYTQRAVDSESEISEKLNRLQALHQEVRTQLGIRWKRQIPQLNQYLRAAGEAIRERANRPSPLAETESGKGVRALLDPELLHRWIEALKGVDSSMTDHPMRAWTEFATAGTLDSDKSLGDLWGEFISGDRRTGEIGSLKSSPSGTLFAEFEQDGFENWFVEGKAFGTAPSPAGTLVFSKSSEDSVQFLSRGAAHSAAVSGRLQGILRSRTFTITNRFLHMFVSGRSSRINVFIDNFALIQAPIYGSLRQVLDDGRWKWLSIDLNMWKGHRAYIEFSDIPTPDLAGGGSRKGYAADGYIAVSRIELSDVKKPPQIANGSPSSLLFEEREIESIEELAVLYGDVVSEALDVLMFDGVVASGERRTAQVLLLNWLIEHDLLGGLSQDVHVADDTGPPALIHRYRALEDSLPNPNRVPAMVDGTGLDGNVFIRGNPDTLGEGVHRQFLDAIDGRRSSGFKNGSGRIDLARRITDPGNPFLARVMVNRVWHHLFGRGIVRTPDDFGVLGQRPTHPELLDWLASLFRDEAAWSTKRLIRLLVMSRTYQMASKPSDIRAEAKDPENLWFHRMPIRRLEGETIRDAMLAVSQQLDTSMFGPSVPVYLTEFMEGRGRPGKSGPLNGDGRRSIYLEVRRNFLSPMMRVFDAPVPFTTAGRRTVSNVPAQSLILMNDPFAVDQARLWARGITTAMADSAEERVERLYLAAFARPPSREEVNEALAFLDRQTAVHGVNSNVSDGAEAWADLCHVLFNVKEFVFLN